MAGRSLVVANIAVGLVLLCLLGLGTWQVQRLLWKQELIATIHGRTAAAAVPLPAGADLDPAAWAWRRVVVRGRFLHEREIHLLGHTRRGNLGYQVVTPMLREGGDAVLVNRGWVPSAKKDPATRPESQPAGTVTVEGIVRSGWQRSWFVPENDVARNVWFYADVGEMRRHAAVDAPAILVEAVAGADPAALPVGGQTRLDIPNNHLQYVVTWYALAAVLVVMYVLVLRRRRARAEP